GRVPETLRQVGRYEIVREVGRGGMAVVYLARQTDLDRDVALKELGSFYVSDESFAERFVRESRVAGSLSHPNIVTVYDFFQHDGVPYIAMEYVERGSLRPLIGKLTVAQAAGALEGLLAGLAHAAKRRIVHRDLKPENLMVSAEGAIKIADFGIAKALTSSATANLTATGTAVGTPAYMAPEQVLGTGVTTSTDLYSTGVIAFELLTGRVPFDHEETLALMYRHINEPVPDIGSINPDLDPQLGEWVTWLLAKTADERPRTPSQAWDALEEIVIGTLGARWRRDSRLLAGRAPAAPQPDTPEPAVFPQTTPAQPRQDADAAKPATEPTPVKAALRPAPSTVRAAAVAEAGVQLPTPTVTGRRQRLWLAGIPVALVIAGVVLAAVLLSGGGSNARHPQRPVASVRVSPPVITGSGRTVKVSLPIRGGALDQRSLIVGSLAISTGRATFKIVHRGLVLASGTSRPTSGKGLTVGIRSTPGGAFVTLSTHRGAFVSMTRPVVRGTSVAFTMTKRTQPKPKPPATTTTTTPAITPPPPPPPPKPHIG
ncbi:MAG: protein kinase, partial [Gaiellaceae bacterium]